MAKYRATHCSISTVAASTNFAPLKDLKPRGARVYLGAIHGMASFKERITVARKYLPDFGLGAYCGFGRLAPAELPNVLADHIKAAEIAGFH